MTFITARAQHFRSLCLEYRTEYHRRVSRVFRTFGVLILGAALTYPVAAASATPRDPLDLERFPHSTIVKYDLDEALLPREFAIGRVDKSRRDVRAEREVRPEATRETATYEMPPATKPEDVVNHYRGLLGSGTIFTCKGRDCGRSNDWANYIFGEAILYGPDIGQFYLAAELGEHLVSVYVIERGNKRVYAHLEVLRPQTPMVLRGNAEVVQRLAGDGITLISGVKPDRNGVLSDGALTLLGTLGDDLTVFNGQTLYVVCHLYGPVDAERLIERSTECAGQAARALATDNGPEFRAFGAGPLLPRTSGAASRLELVLPHRLNRD